jgi:ABC-type nitrate/sulfonate/bicarbonate transport system permease component
MQMALSTKERLSRSSYYKWIVRISSVIIVLIVWQIYGSHFPLVTSTPTDIAVALVSLFTSQSTVVAGMTFPTALALTLWAFFVGYVVAIVVGIAVGAAMYASKWIETALDPYITAMYNAPYVALVPLFMIFFGVDFLARVIVVLLSVVFVVIINSNAGFKNAGSALVETGKSFRHSGIRIFQKVVFPGALPYIMTGARIGVARGLVGIIVAESVVQIVQLGYMLQYYGEVVLAVGPEMAIIVVIGLISLFLTEIFKRAETAISGWKVSATSAAK